MDDLIRAKNLLKDEDYTAVLCKGDCLYKSTLRGVKPLVIWVESQKDFSGYAAADKVVGKATAFLYTLLGVREIYAQIISKPALAVLQDHRIFVEYDRLVDNIINRQGNGICPFEQQVLDVLTAENAYVAIREKMKQLNITL